MRVSTKGSGQRPVNESGQNWIMIAVAVPSTAKLAVFSSYDSMELDDAKQQYNAWNDEAEAATAKLWAVYVAEAEKYDQALVDSWRSNMGGMLIFAGLFSASLTAFITESYQTLSPNTGAATVVLLAQISQQLAASVNGSAFVVSQPAPFDPPATAVVCNALWFISLGLSLTCALIITLVEQSARDYLHKANLRSAPFIRARIFCYLYYGLKRFNMHFIVEVVPLLLHASLLFFFAGLVAFLHPVNRVMMIIAAVLLGLVTAIYVCLTVLPIISLDCPYRTPLSGAFWVVARGLTTLMRNFTRTSDGADWRNLPMSPRTESMIGAMTRQALHNSDERASRDLRALVWTLKLLTDDIELETFVESIPDALWGPSGRPGHTTTTYGPLPMMTRFH
ncbi:hypothetical protein B0H10DRAFT_2300371 [Mycena sp. CBHHK59/15]|nr:hypothetical protein B0H10DRAFT_2300371 [Mycena sp. CBHHK59/15]